MTARLCANISAAVFFFMCRTYSVVATRSSRNFEIFAPPLRGKLETRQLREPDTFELRFPRLSERYLRFKANQPSEVQLAIAIMSINPVPVIPEGKDWRQGAGVIANYE